MHQENKDKKGFPQRDIIKDEFDTARRKDEIYRETMKWMREDPKLQQYFSQIQPQSVEHVISFYAWQKAGWIVKKEANEWLLETKTLKYKNAAEKCLQNIQQKKLFDIQCRWRAREFEHPALQTTCDFIYWERNVLNCPFLDPITQEDVDLYIEYIHTRLGEDLPYLANWQDYNTYNSSFVTIGKMMNPPEEEIEDEEEDEEELYENDVFDEENEFAEEDEDDERDDLMPAWYVFWNTRRGDSHYLLLPDLRQEKEWFYIKLAHDEQKEKTIEKFKTNPPDTRPSLFLFGKEQLIPFIQSFDKDSKEVLSAYDAHLKLMVEEENQQVIYLAEEAWEELSDCYENFPLAQGFTDWKEALVVTAKRWKNTKIARLIPIVFDEYEFRRQCGIEQPYNSEQEAAYRKIRDDFKENILRGRELNGEPRDLNF